jgi:hypothetical protein
MLLEEICMGIYNESSVHLFLKLLIRLCLIHSLISQFPAVENKIFSSPSCRYLVGCLELANPKMMILQFDVVTDLPNISKFC